MQPVASLGDASWFLVIEAARSTVEGNDEHELTVMAYAVTYRGVCLWDRPFMQSITSRGRRASGPDVRRGIFGICLSESKSGLGAWSQGSKAYRAPHLHVHRYGGTPVYRRRETVVDR